jgi:6-pyruvoyltetrahydropterin/6-carboxytetrahydropterin synthase
MPQCGEGGRLVEDLIPIVRALKNPLRSAPLAGPALVGPVFSSRGAQRAPLSGIRDGQGLTRLAEHWQVPVQAGTRLGMKGGRAAGSPPPSNLHEPIVPWVTVTRRLRFNAAHRVHNAALSDEENARLFGKCNHPNWHGHNYTLDVSVSGPVDARTGYVMDLGDLRDVVTREIIDKVDHRNLNLDVDFMAGLNPTSENLVVAMWNVLAPRLGPSRLTKLRLWETEQNYVEYQGRDDAP